MAVQRHCASTLCNKEEETMKRKPLVLAALVACSICAFSQAVIAQSAAPNPPRINFKAEAPLKLPPDMYFGEVAGLAVNSKGHVFIFHRGNSSGPAYAATAAQLLEFDGTGKFIREIGHNLYSWSFAHAVRVDKSDNIWTVDKGSSTVIKFNPEGRVVGVFGRKDEASDYRALPSRDVPRDLKAPIHRLGIFNQPTDVSFDSAGNVYISDGYENSRVAKINNDGAWIKSWGERGTGPGQFLTPHGIAVDNGDNVYVADRGNARIQVFDTNGKFLRQFTLRGQVPFYPLTADTPNPLPMFITMNPATRNDDPSVQKAYPDAPPVNLTAVPGAPDAICITPGQHQFLYVADVNPSRIYKVTLEGKVVGMMGDPGGKLGEFRAIHGLACQDERTIWVADMFNWRAQKLTMQ
jgi:DNA-binding beta-propeller fold protein YncE